jgi:caffeoyl-CoA O-methyltransferase
LRLSQPGSLILADNTIRGGSVLYPEDESARAIREFNEALAKNPRLSALILPLIRERVDGLAIARVL